MALEFARTHILTRSAGHTAVRAAAYRAGERLHDARAGVTADYTHRAGDVRHREILLPEGGDVSLLDRQTLWSAVEDREDQHNRRASAQLAKDHIIALPRELTPEQQIALAVAFAREEFVSRGLVVDLAVHDHSEGNPHAHLLTTTRVLEGRAFTDKCREVNGRFSNGRKIADEEQLRHRWAEFQNAWCRERGLDVHVLNHDGQAFPAEVHLGPAKAIGARGELTPVGEQHREIVGERTRLIVENPEIVIERVSRRKSLFVRHDLYREAHALIDDGEAFALVKAKLDIHPSLEVIRAREGGAGSPMREFLTTRAVIELEQSIRDLGERLGGEAGAFAGSEASLEAAVSARPHLSEEQIHAARHLVAGNRLALVAGLAGAGKSTMLDAVRETYARDGHAVRGLALAGKAADELAHSAGIESRTIASWLMAIESGRETIEAGTVYALDEAGMVDNRTLHRVLEHVERSGAKLVLIGDSEQLQPILAGCPFRDLGETLGVAEIATIRRQREAWQRQATSDLARGRPSKAFAAYERAGHVHHGVAAAVHEALVARYLERPEDDTAMILAHRNVDVAALNARVRAERKAAGELVETRRFGRGLDESDAALLPSRVLPGDRVRLVSGLPGSANESGVEGTVVSADEHVATVRSDAGVDLSIDAGNAVRMQPLEVVDARLELAVGDRVLFGRNDNRLGVKNGMLGTVVRFDGASVRVLRDDGEVTDVDPTVYPHLSHGYATTVHKAQGVTVDRAYLLGSASMDRHLAYVGMSRHRRSLDIYLPEEPFRHRPFTAVIARSSRQASALAFAEKHGLVFEAAEGRLVPGKLPEETMIENVEPAVRAGVDGGVGASAARPPTERELGDARREIETVTQEHVARLEQAYRGEQRTLERLLATEARALARHRDEKPREGLLASKTKLAAWQRRFDALELEVGLRERAVQQHVDEFALRASGRRAEAHAQACRERPEAAAIVERGKRIAEARALHERWRALERQRERETDPRELLHVERQIREIAEALGARGVLGRELPGDERRLIAAAHERSGKALARADARDRGLSR